MPKHASASLAVLDLVMASPAQPAARRSPRRPCLLSARSDGQLLPRSDQKGKTQNPFDPGPGSMAGGGARAQARPG